VAKLLQRVTGSNLSRLLGGTSLEDFTCCVCCGSAKSKDQEASMSEMSKNLKEINKRLEIIEK
jgi:hypothetical protein